MAASARATLELVHKIARVVGFPVTLEVTIALSVVVTSCCATIPERKDKASIHMANYAAMMARIVEGTNFKEDVVNEDMVIKIMHLLGTYYIEEYTR